MAKSIKLGEATMSGPHLLRPADAMARLEVGRTTLWQLTRSGALPSVLIGRSRRYLTNDIDAYLAAHRVTKRQPVSTAEQPQGR
jgi:excisionase family DNA binding protein